MQADCVANAQGKQSFYPVKSKKSPNPSKFSLALKLVCDDKTLWLQRPDTGIWGGLWCLPLAFVKKQQGAKNTEAPLLATWQQESTFEAEYNTAEQIIFAFLQAEQLLNIQQVNLDSPDTVKHSLTHFHWFLTPLTISLNAEQHEKLTKKLQQAMQSLSWVKNTQINSLAKPKAMQLLVSG